MRAATHARWSLRLPRRARAFTNLLGVAAVVVAGHFLWLQAGNGSVLLLMACILLVAGARHFILRRRIPVNARDHVIRLERPAMGHWRVVTGCGVADGTLDHVWYGWGWITLRIRVYAQSDLVTVTVWRGNVSRAAWHQLRVCLACELAMTSSPSEAEVR